MPAPNATSLSPPPVAGSSKTPSPPSPSSSSVHQVGSRQGTRTRTRTRRNMSSSASGSHRTPRYNNEDHPLAPHNLEAQGYHSFRCLSVPFHVKKRYTFVRELGIGAYGCVALCRDEVLDCNVAIKKVTRIFEKDVLARRALREVAVLRHIGMCDNVTALLDFDTAFIEFSEIYLVLSASEADLSQIIRSRQALSDAHLQYFMAQILRGVRYMHSAKIIHRDLKPGNLLVNADCALRICDFGLARAYADEADYPAPTSDKERDYPRSSQDIAPEDRPVDGLARTDSADSSKKAGHQHDEAAPPRSASPASDLHLQLSKADIKGKQRRLNYPGGPLTEYVATRWYRAPEVMLCFREGYGAEIDMWSVGCILAELIAGKPIFPGKDYVDQIARINNILGSPTQDVIDKIGSERARTYVRSLPDMPQVPLQHLYPNANPEALDLVAKLLTWNPDERLTADEALRHPWLKAYHESNARWQPPRPFDKFDEVEFIHSLRQFKGSLQREADELRLELEAMEREEAEAQLNGDDADAYAQQDEGQDERSSVAEAESGHEHPTTGNGSHENGSNGVDVNGSGNGPRADDDIDRHSSDNVAAVDADVYPATTAAIASLADRADSKHQQHQQQDQDQVVEQRKAEDDAHAFEGDALSCYASTHSDHVPASTASSSSSIRTPSTSSSGASADEAEPPSPRAYEPCRMAKLDKASHLEEGRVLRKPPSFFRLGHEEEGRLSCGWTAEYHDDVFMPTQVLTVARGLVDYQLTAQRAADGRATCILPTENTSTPSVAKRSTSVFTQASNQSSEAGARPLSGVSGSTSHVSQSSTGNAARGGLASTSSLGRALLDDAAIVHTDGSSAKLKGGPSHRHGKQLVILQDSLVLSSVRLMRELILRTLRRQQRVLVVAAQRSVSVYLDNISAEHVAVIDATSLGDVYAPNPMLSLKDLARRIADQIHYLGHATKVTVLIDSLDRVADVIGEEGVQGTIGLVRDTISALGGSSRLVVGIAADAHASTSAALLASLHSSLIWAAGREHRSDGLGVAAPSTGTVMTARLHSPALLRHIVKSYGIKPPSTSAGAWDAVASDAFMDERAGGTITAATLSDTDAEASDARFWEVLRNISTRGPLGIPSYEAGGGAPGWWAIEGCQIEALSGAVAAEQQSHQTPTPNGHNVGAFIDVISLADLLNPSKTGYAILELHHQARTGKSSEELVGLVSSTSSDALRLVPLDMVDQRQALGSMVAAPAASGLATRLSNNQAMRSSSSSATRGNAGGGDAHTSMMSTLPFNLSETDEQRQRRETVPLPYAYHQQQLLPQHTTEAGATVRGSTGNATIFFEPEQDDDEDDEDPDDDLDL
ncbi:Pkinase-domain-containing protein [Testicularia cyperi]|uniref:Mitogen-activated protein kinase n=1 Tax=Testicularia cyperi TaxID=1882483 RepID=A0A317XPY8_9BASI|nr:Pkinase-domain-containing protein [Testicularia cyperi]